MDHTALFGQAARLATALVLIVLAFTLTTGASALPLAHCQHRIATIVGTPAADVIVGTPARDIIAAWDGMTSFGGVEATTLFARGREMISLRVGWAETR